MAERTFSSCPNCGSNRSSKNTRLIIVQCRRCGKIMCTFCCRTDVGSQGDVFKCPDCKNENGKCAEIKCDPLFWFPSFGYGPIN